jgi:hypothetical protein
MRKTLSVVGAGLAVAIGIVLTILPVRGFLGLDPATLGGLEVAIATFVATVLLWYGFYSN